MSKSLILKIILGGFLVFLLLPAFYDEEKPAQKSSFKDAYGFNPDGYEGEELPVLEEETPSKENIFTRYGKRFKQMYGRAFFNAPEQREEAPRIYAGSGNEGGDEDLYYAMAMLFNSSEEPGSLRSSYAGSQGGDRSGGSVNALPSGEYAGGRSSMKQTVHSNAPVKGLYESSSVESYENRTKAKQVYSNVMKKVDGSVPAKKSAAGVDEQNISSAESGRLESFRNGVPGVVSTPGWAADISDSFLNGAKFNRVYTGISSRNSSKGGYNSSRANSGGNYSGFSNSKANFTDKDRNTENLSDHFIQDFIDLETKIKNSDAAKVLREGSSHSSSYSSSNAEPDIKIPGGDKAGQEQEKDSGKGQSNESSGGSGQGSSQGGADGGDDFGGDGADKPVPVVPSAEDKAFNEELYTNIINGGSCGVSNEDLADSQPAFRKNFSSIKNNLPQAEDTADKIQVDSCSGEPVPVDNVPALPDEISSKQVLVDLGAVEVDGRNLRATPGAESLAAAGIKVLGFGSYIPGTQKIPSSKVDFNGIDREQFIVNANNQNTIIITISQAIAEAYVGRTVLINPGDLEKPSAIRQIAERLNNMDQETQRILAAKEAREASAR